MKKDSFKSVSEGGKSGLAFELEEKLTELEEI